MCSRTSRRCGGDRAFGGQLDSLIDVVNYGVAPAVVLMSYGQFNPVFLAGAFFMIAAATIRLSYFNTFGLAGGTKYTGLALDNNNLIHVFVFLFAGLFSTGVFSVILYVSGLGIAALNVSQIKTPKLSGNPVNVGILAVYTLGITGVYGWRC